MCLGLDTQSKPLYCIYHLYQSFFSSFELLDENGSYFDKSFAIKKIRGDKLTFKSTSNLKKNKGRTTKLWNNNQSQKRRDEQYGNPREHPCIPRSYATSWPYRSKQNTTSRLSTRIRDTQVYHLKTRHVGLTREEDTHFENTQLGGYRETLKGWFKKTHHVGLLLKDATRRRPSKGHDAQRLGQFWEIFENTCKINPLLPEGNCDYLFIT